jgi:hypothetical protein
MTDTGAFVLLIYAWIVAPPAFFLGYYLVDSLIRRSRR